MAKIIRRKKGNTLVVLIIAVVVVAATGVVLFLLLKEVISGAATTSNATLTVEAATEMESSVRVAMTKIVEGATAIPSQTPLPTATLMIPTLPQSTPTSFSTPVPEWEDEDAKVPVAYGNGFVMEFKGFRPESLTAPRLSPEKAIAYPLEKGEGSSGCEYNVEGDIWLFGDTTAAHAGVENTGIFSWETGDIAKAISSVGENPDDYYVVGDATSLTLKDATGEAVFVSSKKGNTFVFSLISTNDHTLTLNSGACYAVHRRNFDGYLLLRYRHLACRGKIRMPILVQGGYPGGSIWSAFTSTTDVDKFIADHQ